MVTTRRNMPPSVFCIRALISVLVFAILMREAESQEYDEVLPPEIELQTGSIHNLVITDESYDQFRRLPAWVVSAPDECRILVRFVTFQLQHVDDTLVIGSGSDYRDSSTFFARFSGLFPRRSVLLPSSEGWLWLNSTLDGFANHRLHLELEAIYPVQIFTLPQTGSLKISPPGYPLDYPSFADITWLIRIPDGKCVVVRFTDVDLEEYYDKIIVGSGPDILDHSAHLTRISGRFNRTDTPTDVIVANQTYVWLKFLTDNSKTFSGFLVDVFTRPELTQDFNTGDQRGKQISLDFDIPVNLASANYPQRYLHKQNVTWYVTPPINAAIRVDVISCHMEKKHDAVRIGSKSTRDDPIVISGFSMPHGFHVVYPVNESLRIEFATDFSVSYQGFWIRLVAQYPVEKTNEGYVMTVTMPTAHNVSDGPNAAAREDAISRMMSLLCGLGVVFFILLVVGCIFALFFVKRRRTRPTRKEQPTGTHLYTAADEEVVFTPDYSSTVLQQSPSSKGNHDNHSAEACSLEGPYAEYDYDACMIGKPEGQGSKVARSPGSEHNPRDHVYSVAMPPVEGVGKDDDGYSKISGDAATTTDNDYAATIDNHYASCDDGLEVISETTAAGNLLTKIAGENNPYYSTSISKVANSRKAGSVHVYAPMSKGSPAKRGQSCGSPRKPPRPMMKKAKGTGSCSNDDALAYANLIYAISNVDNTQAGKVEGSQQADVALKSEPAVSKTATENVNGTYDTQYIEIVSAKDDYDVPLRVPSDFAEHGETDTYLAGHRRGLTSNAMSTSQSGARAPNSKHKFSPQPFAYSNALYVSGDK